MQADRPPSDGTPGAGGGAKPTIRAVADLAGVAVPTAYQALRGEGLREETRERVLSAAESLGYQINAAARSMRSQRFHAVALVNAAGAGGHADPGVLSGVMHRLAADRFNLFLTELPPDDEDDTIPRVLSELSVDGLLVYDSGVVSDRLHELVLRLQVPVVWINREEPRDAVFPDDRGAARAATKHLLGLGHRRVTLALPGKYHHWSERARRDGYEAAVAEAGLPGRVAALGSDAWIAAPDDPAYPDAGALAERLFSGPKPPTAVLAYDERMATLVLRLARLARRRVPEDVSVSAFTSDGPLPHAAALDAWRVPQEKIGEAAVDLLLARIAGRRRGAGSLSVPLTHVRGETVGPPPPGTG